MTRQNGPYLQTRITDISGKTLFSKTLKRTENGELKVELAEKPAAGMYILSVKNYVMKIIVQ